MCCDSFFSAFTKIGTLGVITIFFLAVPFYSTLSRFYLATSDPTHLAVTDINACAAPLTLTIDYSKFNTSIGTPQFFDLPVKLNCNPEILINQVNVPKVSSGFIILQVHSFITPVTLSYNKTLSTGFHVNGTNIGLVYLLNDETPATVEAYVHKPIGGNVPFFVSAVVYQGQYPIPGGCNLEFPVKISSYLNVKLNPDTIVVDSQPASISGGKICDGTLVKHRTFHFYLPLSDYTWETYFFTLKKFRDPEYILNNAVEVGEPLRGPQLRRTYSRYYGTAEIFLTTVTYENLTTAYVPALTYACEWDFKTNHCKYVEPDPQEGLLGIFFLLTGLNLCFYGHVYFKTSLFIIAFLSGFCFCFTMTTALDMESPHFAFYYSAMFGFIFGLFWVFIWLTYTHPGISMLLGALLSGVLLSAFVFFSILSDFQVMQIDLDYWLLFACISLVLTAITLRGSWPNVVICGTIGTFLLIAEMDLFLNSTLKYTVINQYRRIVNPEFSSAIIDPPIRGTEQYLIILGIFTYIFGTVHQLKLLQSIYTYPVPNQWFFFRQERQPLLTSVNRGSHMYT